MQEVWRDRMAKKKLSIDEITRFIMLYMKLDYPKRMLAQEHLKELEGSNAE